MPVFLRYIRGGGLIGFLLLCFFQMLHAQIDQQASCETRSLYRHLKVIAQQNLLFGHQNTTYEGIGWKDREGLQQRSDVWDGVGDFPAVYGFDFIDGWDTYGIFQQHVRQAFLRGSIITFSDHFDNPATGGDPWDTGGDAVAAILDQEHEAHLIYKLHLDEVAAFFQSLQIGDTLIPIIFRPFHENSGNWFWWGRNQCTPEQFKAIWRFTVEYLRDEKGVHNLLYAYSPINAATMGGYGDRYPGDDYVDIIGLDYYEAKAFGDGLKAQCQFVVTFAYAHEKVAALTEFGYHEGILYASSQDWFMSELLSVIRDDPVASHLAWALTWRNDRPTHHWVPTAGAPTFASFQQFYEDPFTAFGREVPPRLYDCASMPPAPDIPDFVRGEATLFPNPTTGLLNVRIDEQYEGPFDIQLTDAMGRRAANYSSETHELLLIPLSLPAGIYTVQIFTHGRTLIYTGRLAVR